MSRTVAIALAGAAVMLAAWWASARIERNAFERGQENGRTEVQGRWDKSELERAAEARATEADIRRTVQRQQSQAMEASNAATNREAALRAAAVDARAERDGLLGDLAAAARARQRDVSATACQAHDARIAALERVFASCTGRYLDLAERAGRHASDAVMLDQAWPQ